MVIDFCRCESFAVPVSGEMEALLSGKTQPAENLCAEDSLVQFFVV